MYLELIFLSYTKKNELDYKNNNIVGMPEVGTISIRIGTCKRNSYLFLVFQNFYFNKFFSSRVEYNKIYNEFYFRT